jgi:hypothetical protein
MIYTILTLPTVPAAITVLNDFNESHGLSNDFYWSDPNEPDEDSLGTKRTPQKMKPIDGFRCEVMVPGTALNHFIDLLELFEAQGFPLLIQESTSRERNQAPEDRQLKAAGVFYTSKGQVNHIDIQEEDYVLPLTNIDADALSVPEALQRFQDYVRQQKEKTTIPSFENQIEYGKRARMAKLISTL